MQREELLRALAVFPEACIALSASLVPIGLNEKARALVRADSRNREGRLTGSDLFSETSRSSLLTWLAGSDDAELSIQIRIGSEAAQCWTRASHKKLLLDGETAYLLSLRRSSGPDLRRSADMEEYRRLREATVARKVGIFEHDHLTDELYGNGEVRAQYGLDPTEPLSIQVFAGGTHPDDVEHLLKSIAQAHDPTGDGVFDVRHRILPKTGGTRWIHTRAQTRFRANEQGELVPRMTTGSVIDITEHHLREEENRRLAAIVNATVDLVAMTDLNGRLTYLNQAGRRLIGLDAGTKLPDLHAKDLLVEEHQDDFLHQVVPSALEEGFCEAEWELRGQAGAGVPVSAVVLAHEPTRSIGAYLSIIARDLSRQKNLEAQLLHAQKLEAVGRLAGGIAHDFNNLLSVIVGFASLPLSKPELDPETRTALEETLRASERAASLTQQLLSFSRKQVLRPVVLDAREVLEDLTPMLRHLIPENITLTLNLAGAPSRLKVDRSQLEQAVVNLVINAKDALPSGGSITIETELARKAPRPSMPEGDYLSIIVSDDGEGIPKELLDRIFDPFFTTKPQGKGTGLGLSTVFGITTQSHGDIAVFSEPDHGTTFKLFFPLSKDPQEARDPAPRSGHTIPGDGHVLIVEDEPQLRRVLAAVLAKAGYEVTTVSGPVEALTIARADPAEFALVLTDIVMPQMTGIELVRRLESEGLRLPALFMSGYAEEVFSTDSELTPGINFLPKPIDPAALVSSATRLIAEGRRQAGRS